MFESMYRISLGVGTCVVTEDSKGEESEAALHRAVARRVCWFWYSAHGVMNSHSSFFSHAWMQKNEIKCIYVYTCIRMSK